MLFYLRIKSTFYNHFAMLKKEKHKSDFQGEGILMFCFTSFLQSKLVK